MENLIWDYIDYHKESARIRDIDPANDCLRYIADRFELNLEQRYWIAFLYSTCYCAPTVFYMYNEFPDFENVDEGRLQRWWDSNKHRCIFQTDRLRIKSNNEFVPSFKSYKAFIGSYAQSERFAHMMTPSPYYTWKQAEAGVTSIKNIGRFTSFIYLEMINVLTDFQVLPDTIDWNYADNCKKGLLKASNLSQATNQELDRLIKGLQKKLAPSNIFNIETTLCAYEKHRKGQRYVGYYIDRQYNEIKKIKELVSTGVCWDVLDQFRLETYKPENLIECKTY